MWSKLRLGVTGYFWDKSQDWNIAKEKCDIGVKLGRNKNICYRMLQGEKNNIRNADVMLL